jgi:hypothetical protein
MAVDWVMKAPQTEQFWADLTAVDLADLLAGDQIELDGMDIPADLDSSPFSIRGGIRSWELMIRGMADGWPPFHYYLIDEFVNDLITRDRIERSIGRLASSIGSRIRDLLDVFDDRFLALTKHDSDGELIAPYSSPLDVSRLGWWWRRRVREPQPWLGR